eukprot:a342616_50.p3 GENE.a342616_50~~a342616_50.p3  ORF type:complete len:160 (-),score=72.80 a342616_50:50-493(-)
MITLNIVPEYGYVVLSIVALWFLNLGLGEAVAMSRKRYGVKLPQMYGPETPDGTAFNRVQRGHQNYLETVADVYMGILLAGLSRPTETAGLTVLFIIGRILYAYGYRQAEGKRVWGAPFFMVARIGWLVIVLELAYNLLNGRPAFAA